MKVHYVTPTGEEEDIAFWDKDITHKNKEFGCLAFFYDKEYAEMYADFLQGHEHLDIDYEVRSVELP